MVTCVVVVTAATAARGWGGSPGTPVPERMFLANVMSYMQEPLIDLATCGTLTEVDGREVRTGNPIEIVSTRRELQYMRQGLKRVGRAGMGNEAHIGSDRVPPLRKQLRRLRVGEVVEGELPHAGAPAHSRSPT